MPQHVIDLDKAVPANTVVKIGGKRYELPADIPIPDFIELERLVDDIGGAGSTEGLERLYEKVLEIFRVHQPDVESLPIGPHRLGVLMVGLYGGEAEPNPPKRRGAGTRSTSRTKPRRSRSSK